MSTEETQQETGGQPEEAPVNRVKSATVALQAKLDADAVIENGEDAGEADKETPAASAGEGEGEAAGEEEPEDGAEDKPEEADPAVARGLAKLTAREKGLRAEALKLKGDREAAAAERAQLQAEREKLEQLRRAPLEDPLAFMEAHGIKFEDVQDQVVNGRKPTADLKTKAQLQTVQQQVDELVKERRGKEQQEAEASTRAQLAAARAQASELVAKDARFELVRAEEDGADQVLQEIGRHWRETAVVDDDGTVLQPGKTLSFEAAAARVEARLEKRAERILTAEKIKSKLGKSSKGAPAPAPANSEKSGHRAAPKTLTNATASSAPPATPKPITAHDRRKAAAQRIRFKEG